MAREELLRMTSEHLGYRRLSEKAKALLRGHLRAGIRRKIVGTDPTGLVWLETPAMADYTIDELVSAICSMMRKRQNYEIEDVIYSVAYHLGFSRLAPAVRAPIESALNAASRRHLVAQRQGQIRRLE